MANGRVIEEITRLLKEEGIIETNAALRLSLQIQADNYDLLTNSIKDIANIKERVSKLETLSILMWVSKHPKVSFLLLFVYVTLSSVIDVKAIILDIIKLFA